MTRHNRQRLRLAGGFLFFKTNCLFLRAIVLKICMDREVLKLQANRFRVLLAAYRFLQADTARWVDVQGLCREKTTLDGQFDIAFRYLLAEGLLKRYGSGNTAMLTHAGIKAIEAALTQPDQPTQYFPAVASIERIHNGTIAKL